MIRLRSLVSTEDHNDGRIRKENERMYLAKCSLDVLQRAAVDPVKQEQYDLQGVNGAIRVRAIDDKEFILCSKAWEPGVDGKDEVEDPVSEGQFNIFKRISPRGLCKVRYHIPIDGTEGWWKPEKDWTPPYDGKLVWEVDVFYPTLEFDKPAEWVKIDLEIPPGIKSILPTLPDIFTDVFDVQFRDRTPEQQRWVADIMDSVSIKRA